MTTSTASGAEAPPTAVPAALTVDDLLLGGRATHAVTIPADVVRPGDPDAPSGQVVLRPLVLADVHRVQKAARDDQALTSVLMVQQALVEPSLTIEQVNRLHCGLVEFLLGEVNRISGLRLGRDELEDVVRAPMARACFELAREFGWTPDECAALTVGQVLMYLELLGRGAGREAPLR
jgi:hypothetical protein